MTSLLKHPQIKAQTFLGNQPPQFEEKPKLNPAWYRLASAGMGEPGPKFIYRFRNADLGKVSFANNEDFMRIMSEFEKAIAAKEWFDKLGASYRRGFLLYGPPGTGKTTLQQEVCNYMVEKHSAIVIDLSQVDYRQLELTKHMIEGYRSIHPDQIFVVAMGDLNAGMFHNETLDAMRTALEMFSKTPLFWFATTNEFDKLDKSIVARPGRFDTRILIQRLPYSVVKSICELNFIGDLTDELFKNRNLTPAIIREVAIRHRCFGMDAKDAINSVNEEFEQKIFSGDEEARPKVKGKNLIMALKKSIPAEVIAHQEPSEVVAKE